MNRFSGGKKNYTINQNISETAYSNLVPKLKSSIYFLLYIAFYSIKIKFDALVARVHFCLKCIIQKSSLYS